MKCLFVVAVHVAIVLVGVAAWVDVGEYEEFGWPDDKPFTIEYLGCFRDDHRRVLGAANKNTYGMDVDACFKFCHSKVIV